MYALCHGGGPCERVTYHPERARKRVSMLMLGMAHVLGHRTDGLGGVGAIYKK
jgi:hypothetical protein